MSVVSSEVVLFQSVSNVNSLPRAVQHLSNRKLNFCYFRHLTVNRCSQEKHKLCQNNKNYFHHPLKLTWRERKLIYFMSILLNSSVLSDYKDRSQSSRKRKKGAPQVSQNVMGTRYPETRLRMEGK